MLVSNSVIQSSRNENNVKVMIVDDSAVIRGLFSKWVKETPGLELLASCSNGLMAVSKSKSLKPDIIILDIEMPEMDGIAALPILIKDNPGVKIIMASTLTRKNAEISLKALSLGAADYLPKPESRYSIVSTVEFKQELVSKIKALEVNKKSHGFDRTSLRAKKPIHMREIAKKQDNSSLMSMTDSDEKLVIQPFNNALPKILAIGSSTGGPQALSAFFKIISKTIINKNIPIFITQHMPPTFTTILAENLKKGSGIDCKEGVDGEEVMPGICYVAPGGLHMLVEKKDSKVIIKLDNGPPVNYCKPAVDPMFESLADVYGRSIIAVILTGMGYDGASGVVKIRKVGGNIITQDEESSVVWGMPGAAAKTGLCSAILPLERLADVVVKKFGGSL